MVKTQAFQTPQRGSSGLPAQKKHLRKLKTKPFTKTSHPQKQHTKTETKKQKEYNKPTKTKNQKPKKNTSTSDFVCLAPNPPRFGKATDEALLESPMREGRTQKIAANCSEEAGGGVDAKDLCLILYIYCLFFRYGFYSFLFFQ